MATVIKESKIRTSRVGKKPISLPSGVNVTIEGQHVALKGKNGSADCISIRGWRYSRKAASCGSARAT